MGFLGKAKFVLVCSILALVSLGSIVHAEANTKTSSSNNTVPIKDVMQLSAQEISLNFFNGLAESKITKMRQAYQKAVNAYKNGNEALGLSIQQNELEGYPLNIWLDYYRLAYNVDTEHFKEAFHFIQNSGQAELSSLLKERYIKYFSEEKDYQHLSLLIGEKPFDENKVSNLSFAQKQSMCRFYEANWPLNKVNESAVSFATRIYLDLGSTPTACKNLLKLFEDKGYLTDVLRLKRFEQAFVRERLQEVTEDLVKELKRSVFSDRVQVQMAFYEAPETLFKLNPKQDTLVNLVKELSEKDSKTTNKDKTVVAKNIKFNTANDAEKAKAESDIRRVAVLAFKRYANLSPRSARADLNRFKQKYAPSDAEMVEIYQSFAQSFLGRNYEEEDVKWVDRNLPTLAWNTSLKEQRLRRAIYFGQWDKVYLLIKYLPQDIKQQINWRYWQGRSALELGRKDEGTQILTSVANDRSFFGFFAAQSLGLDYAFNYVKIDPNFSFPMDIANNKAAVRFLELYAIESEDAIYEWREIAKRSSEKEAMIMAQWALQTGNVSYAIDYVISSKHWDALDYRFPLAYRDYYEQQAKENNVSLSFLYGVSRQESMLNPKIRSWAGAVGLMQLMPATAKDIAKRKKWSFQGANSLTDPETNIKYGSTYLRWMLDKFDNNRVLAAAAYNAGPGRIPQWKSKDGKQRDVVMYIESIPFSETRQYVQNVLLYDTIYNFLLTGKSGKLLSKQELAYHY